MKGRRRKDTLFGDLPPRLHPGDYWKYVNEDGTPIEPYTNFPPEQAKGNLTKTVWGFRSPNGKGIGTLMIHTVREEDDGTMSVRAGDGSSNSIMVNRDTPDQWHGYVEHGVWNEC